MYKFMKIFKILLTISTFLIPISVKADFDLLDSAPSFNSTNNSGNFTTSTDKYRTSKNNWGKFDKESEIDLSEWGGRVPTCAEAPGCPICTN